MGECSVVSSPTIFAGTNHEGEYAEHGNSECADIDKAGGNHYRLNAVKRYFFIFIPSGNIWHC